MVREGTGIPRKVLEYLNSYPAFNVKNTGDCSTIEPGFWDTVMRDIYHSPYLLKEFAGTSRMIWEWHSDLGHLMTIKDVRKFLEWLEPIYCKYKDIVSTGFDFKTGTIRETMPDGSYYLGCNDLVEI